MVLVVAKGKWADGNVVREGIPHLVSVFEINVCTAYIVKNVALDFGLVGVMNDYSPLLRILDGIIFEETIGALSHFVKMQTIFSLDSCIDVIG